MEWVTQTTQKTWRKRPAKQFLMLRGQDGAPIPFQSEEPSLTHVARTMDFPLHWQGSPVTVGEAVE